MTIDPNGLAVVTDVDVAEPDGGPTGALVNDESYPPSEIIQADLPAATESVIAREPLAAAEDPDLSGLSNY